MGTHHTLFCQSAARNCAKRMLCLSCCYGKKIFAELFPKGQTLESSKLKEFADDNFIFDENGRKFSERVENTVGKGKFE